MGPKQQYPRSHTEFDRSKRQEAMYGGKTGVLSLRRRYERRRRPSRRLSSKIGGFFSRVSMAFDLIPTNAERQAARHTRYARFKSWRAKR